MICASGIESDVRKVFSFSELSFSDVASWFGAGSFNDVGSNLSCMADADDAALNPM